MSVLAVVVKSAILIAVLTGLFSYVMLFERKLLGYFQYRVGPNRTGPWGLLQPLADALKLMLKEDITPREADRSVFRLAPVISLFAALAAYAVLPLGDLHLFGRDVPLSISDPNAGMIYLLAVMSLGVYGISLGGWASQSKYSLLGGLRATAQLISYELAMGLAVIGILILAGTADLRAIVQQQTDLAHWFIFRQPLGFLIFLVTVVADTNRAPFDLPEAETELVGGYNTEYSGMRFGLFFMAEYINVLTVSLLAAVLFLGGWSGPWLPGIVWLLIKAGFVLFLFIWLRATLPRLRYDQLMQLGWKGLFPLALLNVIVTAVLFVFWGGAS